MSRKDNRIRVNTEATTLVISIDGASAIPPYEQVRMQFAQQISARTLAVGTRLPTVRQLAGDLGLAVNTVARAYRELEEAGMIETRGRAGSFVAAVEDTREQLRQAADQFSQLATRLGIDSDEALRIVRAALDT